MPQNTTSDDVNIGSGDGMEPSGNKPSSGLMLTQIYVEIWHSYTTMC